MLGALNFQPGRHAPRHRACQAASHKATASASLGIWSKEGSRSDPGMVDLAVGKGVHFYGESGKMMLKEAATSHSK